MGSIIAFSYSPALIATKTDIDEMVESTDRALTKVGIAHGLS